MRIESSVTTVSWIPSEAVTGMMKTPFEMGVAHYDDPPPEVIDDLDELRAADRFRFANELRAWVDVEDGRVVDAGYSGGGRIGATTLRFGKRQGTFAATELPDLQAEPEVRHGAARFVQTAGGRTGVPAPRRVNHPPFVQWDAPLAWTTLALTIHADGRVEHEVVGASPFPRFWMYDHEGKVTAKSGLIDFKDWYRHAFGKHSPWGDADSPALVTAVETALERELSHTIMRGGAEPKIRKVRRGKTLTEQGAPGDELFLLLDGVLAVEVGDERLAEIGPGAILGERALLEGGTRTATLRAVTKCKVAVTTADQVDRSLLEEISDDHRREEGAERG
jgi:Cyclic nucleotide-binding domain